MRASGGREWGSWDKPGVKLCNLYFLPSEGIGRKGDQAWS